MDVDITDNTPQPTPAIDLWSTPTINNEYTTYQNNTFSDIIFDSGDVNDWTTLTPSVFDNDNNMDVTPSTSGVVDFDTPNIDHHTDVEQSTNNNVSFSSLICNMFFFFFLKCKIMFTNKSPLHYIILFLVLNHRKWSDQFVCDY